jgi:hypothetical protein
MTIEIDSHQYTLLKDYDKLAAEYKHLSFGGKVTYLTKRVELILLAPCRTAMARGEVETGGIGLILTTAICAGISAASTFLQGRRAKLKGEDRSFFITFINGFMNPILQQPISPREKTWADWLYVDVRCGLAHNFTIETGGIEGVPNLVGVTPYGPGINSKQLLEDFATGWSKYLEEVFRGGQNSGLGKLFEQRFDEIFHD